jgi:transmembrane sensor
MSTGKFKYVEDFLIQNSFQMYCARSDAQCVKYWENYIKSNPDQLENIQEAKRLYFILNGAKKPIDESLLNLSNKILYKKHLLSKFRINVFKVAAVFISILSIGFVLYQARFNQESSLKVDNYFPETSDAMYQAMNGERKSVNLPDGTKVLLNAGSTLTLGLDFNNGDRNVILKGEALFDVVHNKTPFTVYTKDFNIKVLGTKFNVKAYEDELETVTSLISGSIQMELKNNTNKQLIALNPGEKLTIRNKSITPTNTNKPTITAQEIEEIKLSKIIKLPESLMSETAWVHNRIEIHEEKFGEFKKRLERWYNVKIEISDPAIQKYTFTAIFTTESIKEALSALQKAKYFSYTINDNKIIITN